MKRRPAAKEKSASRPPHIFTAEEFTRKYGSKEKMRPVENHALTAMGNVAVHEVEGGSIVAVVHFSDADDPGVINEIAAMLPGVEKRRDLARKK